MPTPQDPKTPVEKTATGGDEKKAETGAVAGTGSPARGAPGGMKPQDDDRPPQN